VTERANRSQAQTSRILNFPYVFVNFDNLQVPLPGQLPEVMQLTLGVLVECRKRAGKGQPFS
jgi:hypothetical protein